MNIVGSILQDAFMAGPKHPLPNRYAARADTLPLNWHPVPFQANNHEALCLYMPAKNEKAVLGLFHGFNADPFSFEDDRISFNENNRAPIALQNIFERLNHNGISVVAAALPKIAPKDHSFIDRFEAVNKAFMLDENSPLFKLSNPNSPRHIIAHSAGGLATLRNLNDLQNVAFANKHFENIFIMNPMLGITNVTDSHPFVKKIYRAYANLNFELVVGGKRLFNLNVKDAPAGSTLFDKAYMKIFNIDFADNLPTHGQIIQMRDSAISYLETFNEASMKGLAENMTFILGRDDNCTLPYTSATYAHSIGANIATFNGKHTPIIYDPESLDFLIESITDEKPRPLLELF